MAFANTTYTGNNSTTEYSIGFNYLNTTHVVVTLDTVVQTLGVDYTINVSTNKVTFTSAPGSSVAIVIKRVTPRTVSDIPVSFSNGSGLTALDLNNNQKYSLYILQEALDTQATFGDISLIDDDTMATASDTSVSTSESIKAYVDTTTGLGNVVEDTTPQLGGDLDVNGNDIVSTSNGDINLSPNGTGKVAINTSLEVDNIILNGNAIGSTDTDGDVTILPNGTGEINLQADTTIDGSLKINSTTITGLTTDQDLTLTPNGTGSVVVSTDLDVDNLNVDGNTISSTDANGDINLSPNGSGKVVLDGVGLDASAGTTGQSMRISAGGDFEFYTPTSGGIGNVVEDTSPSLGGQLDVNGNAIGDGTRELLTFTEDGSAVNHVNIENEATGSGPIISSAGDDTNVDLNIDTKGTGALNLGSADSTVVMTGSAISGSLIKDEDNMASDSATHLATQQSIKAYVDASGGGSAGLVYIGSATASTSANLTLTDCFSATYTHYLVTMENLRPSTDSVDLYLTFSTDSGSTFASSGYDYYVTGIYNSSGSFNTAYTAAGSNILVSGAGANNQGNLIGEVLNGSFMVNSPFNSASPTMISNLGGNYGYTDGVNVTIIGGGGRLDASEVDTMRLTYSSGNITSGVIRIYGIVNS